MRLSQMSRLLWRRNRKERKRSDGRGVLRGDCESNSVWRLKPRRPLTSRQGSIFLLPITKCLNSKGFPVEILLSPEMRRDPNLKVKKASMGLGLAVGNNIMANRGPLWLELTTPKTTK
jgi:hypothetical protein